MKSNLRQNFQVDRDDEDGFRCARSIYPEGCPGLDLHFWLESVIMSPQGVACSERIVGQLIC